VRHVALVGDNEADVQVVYGTTNLKMQQRKLDFFVTNIAEMNICGLDKATRFDLDNMVWLPWATEWFEPLPMQSSPIMGALSANAVKMLQLTIMQRQKLNLNAHD
jgi:hypothetical protein